MKKIISILFLLTLSAYALLGQDRKSPYDTDPFEGVVFTSLADYEVYLYMDFEGELTLDGIKGPAVNRQLKAYKKKRDTNIQISGDLRTLIARNNRLGTLNVEHNKTLKTLDCSNNECNAIGIFQSPALRSLNCSNNELETLMIRHAEGLRDINCSNNKMLSSQFSEIISHLPQCPDNDRGKLCVKNTTVQDDNTFSIENYQEAQAKNWDVFAITMNSKGEIEQTPYEGEDISISKAIITYTTLLPVGSTISYDLEAFGDLIADGLSDINSGRGHMTSVILKQSAFIRGDVRELRFMYGGFSEMDFSKNKGLRRVECIGGTIKTLDFSGSPSLYCISFPQHHLESLKIYSCPSLQEVVCTNNYLSIEAVDELIRGLPDRSKRAQSGVLKLIGANEEHNAMPTAELLEIASQKNWEIKMFRKNDDGQSGWVSITKQNVTGVTSPSNLSITITPNPASDAVQIRSAKPFAMVSLFDLLGNKLIGAQCDEAGYCKVDVFYLPEGQYLIVINDRAYKVSIAR